MKAFQWVDTSNTGRRKLLKKTYMAEQVNSSSNLPLRILAMPKFRVHFVLEQSIMVEAETAEDAEDLAKVDPDAWSEPILAEVEAV